MKILNPSTLHKPGGAYSHAVETTGDIRWLHCAGQVGVAPDGTIRDGLTAQAEQAWTNVMAVLAAAGMTRDDIVQVRHLLVHPADVPDYRAVANRFLGDHRPASTMMVLQALARPELLVEVEVVAAA